MRVHPFGSRTCPTTLCTSQRARSVTAATCASSSVLCGPSAPVASRSAATPGVCFRLPRSLPNSATAASPRSRRRLGAATTAARTAGAVAVAGASR
eukprot:CAMPEP_0204077378 /NCGR_PEP_ID=MMETSP0360-20130528/169276_1 /ASSEMBLY_ACC=CAM_ASM_000342 /TAXON_ID=268821 /ORGANISM="Scrippsiella Hangoei, Strain SHTV-5" /LENGTH=95 /DNA_ID=CAMNT_0051025991 /DNA_START=109 /DNA_END=393 /DNA_ORIENTATION=+